MALYESLETLIGASLLALAPQLGVPVPQPDRTGEAAMRLAMDLRGRPEAQSLGPVLDELAREVWLAQEPLATHHSILEHHALALAVLLAELPLEPALTRAAIEASAAAVAGYASPGARLAEPVAHEHSMRATATGVLAARGLRPDLCRFLLDRVLQHLLADPAAAARMAALAPAGRPSFPPQAPLAPAQAPMAEAPPQPAPAVQGDAAPAAWLPAVPDPAPPLPAAVPAAAVPVSLPVDDLLPAPSAAPGAGLAAEHRTAIEAARRELLKPANDAPELRRHKVAAAEALAAGDLELATEHLKCARRFIRLARARTAERLGEEMEALRRQMTEEASASAAMGDVALASGDLVSAANLYAEAAETLPSGETTQRLAYEIRQGEIQTRRGLETGDGMALAAAIAVLRRAVEAAPAAADPRLAVLARRHLGRALLALGERTVDASLLAVAAATLREALSGLARAEAPEAWAETQVDLGTALARLDAEAAAEPGRLEAAASAYEAALEVLTRETAPMRWALAETSLGAVLARLGEQAATEQEAHVLWQQAAASMLGALEVLESHGATEQAAAVRTGLRALHNRLHALLAPPARGAAE